MKRTLGAIVVGFVLAITALEARSQGSSPWPTVAAQLASDNVRPGTELEALVLENQDFSLLRLDEVKDGLPYPPWLRVFWRKAHPEATFSADDPTKGYPRVLSQIHGWMVGNQEQAKSYSRFIDGSGNAWPSLERQLVDSNVRQGTALEALIRENQDFTMLRLDEAKDLLRFPPWLRVYWRKNHPEAEYSASDPTGGYPRVLNEVLEWMLSHQDLKAAPQPPPVPPGKSAGPGLDATLSGELRISGAQTTPRSESDIRVNYFDPTKIIAASNAIVAGGHQAQFWSTDTGATWGQTTLPFTGTDASHSDPTVDWTSDGSAWSTTIGVQGATLRMRAYKSTDNGATWLFDNTFSAAQTNTDKQIMWVDHAATSPFQNNIYAIWHNGLPAFMNRRTGPGGSWQTPIQVSGAESSGTAIGSDVKTNSFGDVFGFWPTTTNRRVFVVKSTNGGATYGTPVQIATTFDSFDIGVPSMASRRALIYVSAGAYRTALKNLVYATWTDLTGAAGCTASANEPGTNVASTCKTRIWFARSTDGGATWLPSGMLNNQAGLNDQFNQWMVVDETTGALGVIYYDTVADPGRKKTDVWYQSSFDDGATWGAPFKVTSAQTDETTAGADSGNQYGDYNSLSGILGVFFPSWTDRRLGGAANPEEIWTAKVTDPACTAPGAPTIGAATTPANNQIQVSFTGAPAFAPFRIYRAVGTCGAPGPFTLLASGVASSPYLDTTVSGGTTYSYKVTGVDMATGNCESAQSGCVNATATGPCTLPATFAGLASVTDAHAASCTLNLAWAAATSSCSGTVTYNVYRSLSAGFVPALANRIATGVSGTSYNDNSLSMSGAAYYYKVRAVDSVSGEETNTVEKSNAPTGPVVSGTFTDTFEGGFSGGGFDNAGWVHNAIAGSVDWAWSTAQVQSPTHSWFSSSQTSVSDRVLVSPPFGVVAGTTLSFFHTFAFEGTVAQCFDGGTLEITTNGGASWSVIPDANFTAGLFNGNVNTCCSNPLATMRAWCAGTVGAMTQVTVNLASFAGNTVQVRWHAGDDSTARVNGWFVDSINIANAGLAGVCSPSPIELMSFEAE